MPLSQCGTWSIALFFALTAATNSTQELKSIPLCRALELLEPGDQMPVVVSGIYTINRLYDPREKECNLNVPRTTCVEFSGGLDRPLEFDILHQESLRIYVTFRGVLFGREPDPQINDTKIPFPARLAAANRSRHCANLYPTKLVVESILKFERVPENEPWPNSTYGEVTSLPYPIEMKPPAYPPVAINLHAEGFVVLSIGVARGKVSVSEVLLGDPELVKEAVANVQTWKFSSDVNTALTIEYEFRLEKRPASEGANPTIEMRLPSYIQITGPSNDW